jgi:RNA polymerase sigma factor (sigma-70 family)
MVDETPFDATTRLVRAAAAGDPDGREALVVRLTPLLLAQARYRLAGAAGRHCEPEDLVQEAWSIALPRLGELRAQQDRLTPVLMKFLATTMLRLTAAVVRRHVVGRAALAPTDSARLGEVPADVSGVVTGLCRRERQDAMHTAIEALPPKLREVLVLRGIEQQANGAVARLLGIDDATVTRRFEQALQRLRAVLPEDRLEDLA